MCFPMVETVRGSWQPNFVNGDLEASSTIEDTPTLCYGTPQRDPATLELVRVTAPDRVDIGYVSVRFINGRLDLRLYTIGE